MAWCPATRSWPSPTLTQATVMAGTVLACHRAPGLQGDRQRRTGLPLPFRGARSKPLQTPSPAVSRLLPDSENRLFLKATWHAPAGSQAPRCVQCPPKYMDPSGTSDYSLLGPAARSHERRVLVTHDELGAVTALDASAPCPGHRGPSGPGDRLPDLRWPWAPPRLPPGNPGDRATLSGREHAGPPTEPAPAPVGAAGVSPLGPHVREADTHDPRAAVPAG